MTRLKFNVAQLLRETVGSRRDYTFAEDALPLDQSLVLRGLEGTVRFTRTASGVFVHIYVRGKVRLTCVRSLEGFDEPLELDIADEFHSIIDVDAGSRLPHPDEEDPFLLDAFHMADVGEAIREYALLALPISPVCDACRDQPVQYSVQSDGYRDPDDDDDETEIDTRLAVLKQWTSDYDQADSEEGV